MQNGKKKPKWKTWEGKCRKWRGNEDECPVCGFKYKNLKTGFKFEDIHQMLWVGTPDYSQWKYKRRHTVLGLWHQIKMSMWDQHLKECEYHQMMQEAKDQYAEELAELVDIVKRDVPF